MNPNWTEGKLEFDFSSALKTEKPDAAAAPLKATDFWVRFPRETWLIEVKDPEAARLDYRPGAVIGAFKEIQNDALLKEHLLPKIYGVYAYLVDSARAPRGRVRYCVVIGLASLSAADRTVLTNKIQRTVDQIGPKVRHGKYWPVVEVHNVESWNHKYPQIRITRHP